MKINWDNISEFIRCERLSYLQLKGQDKMHSKLPTLSDRTIVKKLGIQLYPPGRTIAPIHIEHETEKEYFEKLLSENGTVFKDVQISDETGLSTMIDLITVFNEQITVHEFQSGLELIEPNHNYILGLHYLLMNQFNFDFKVNYLLYTVNGSYKEGVPAGTNLSQFFVKHETTQKAKLIQRMLESRIKEYKNLVNTQNNLPIVDQGPQCKFPQKCIFYKYCWIDEGRLSITNLKSFRRKTLESYIELGITSVDKIPNVSSLSAKQRIEIKDLVEYRPKLNTLELLKFFKKISFQHDNYQILEIKSIKTVLPIVKKSYPFERLPIQITFYKSDDAMGYRSFNLYENTRNYNLIELVDKLFEMIDLRMHIIYFDEDGYDEIFDTMVRLCPKRKHEIALLKVRIMNLYQLFQDRLYIDKYMHFDYSLGSVVKTMFPNIKYKENFDLDAAVAANHFLFVKLLNESDYKHLISTTKYLGLYKIQTLRDVVLQLNYKVLVEST